VANESAESPIALEQCVERIEEELQPAAILLFGSHASGAVRRDSDVDIAVLLGRPSPDAFEVAALKTDLEDILRRPADLVILDRASPILGMEVLRSHRVLQIRDAEALEHFTARTLLAYDDLKRVRAPIEQALLAEKAR
jgi:predicted nucleotidyltransferase